MSIELIGVKVSKVIEDNREQSESSLIEITYNFFGNNLTKSQVSADIKVAYGTEPVKVKIFDTIHDSNTYNAIEVPLSIIFYEMVADNQSNAKFIDLFYVHENQNNKKTYKVIQIDSDGTWHIENSKKNKITFKERTK